MSLYYARFTFISALNPNLNSENTTVCPKLEELVLHTNEEGSIGTTDMEVARADRGAYVRIVCERS